MNLRLTVILPCSYLLTMPRANKLARVPENFHPYRRGPAPQQHPVPPSSTAPTPAPPHVELPNPAPIPSPSPAVDPPTLSPPGLSSRPSSQPQYFHAREMFHNAQSFTINHPQFIDTSHAGSGLKELLKYSMPNAFHDSGARYPPPKCHLGTRTNYIDLITNWALGTSDRKEPILWMHGPFGIGKSAVAQSCAEALERMKKLAATLFFSRSNSDRDDPQRVFTSIAYQIATKYPSFREIIDRRMIEDPALATKSLSIQFEVLLVQPLRQIDVARSGLAECVVIIDGLDECRGTGGQCEIIKIIAASAHNRTTPFRWFITSRPEDPIIRTMNSPAVYPARSRMELPVSRAIDHEILVYLTNEFKAVREDHGLPESWPSEEALTLLVERGAGLWIYVWTIVRFVKDETSLGPEDQLRVVLEFAKEVSAKVGPDNPLMEMDLFYTLITQRIPLKIRTTVQKILLLCSTSTRDPECIADTLRLSAEQFRHACASIKSVMELKGSDLKSMHINFYHTSFLDFMKDPQRSKDLCIYGDFLIGCRRELLEWLHKACSHSTDSEYIAFSSGTTLLKGLLDVHPHDNILLWFWELCEVREHPFDSQTAWSLVELPFVKMLRLVDRYNGWQISGGGVRDNLPAELCDKIIRKGRCPIPGCMNTKDVWILGHGENEAVPQQMGDGCHFVLKDNQGLSNSKCVCGAPKQADSNEGQQTDIEDTGAEDTDIEDTDVEDTDIEDTDVEDTDVEDINTEDTDDND
ncbi:hypothetical protein D9756_009838 [Leucocoprinus leucothites]|uniref:Nephrocystin 3-like N-terminal domain-containing protein n=1 Tax=Leucocoprinus leucothites TaxID=201217 RepID=A0A8H5CVQ1_9AGAR|nr:hypothetical protein D9756_009838 [Leucoagaricus leucothites]